MKKLFLALSIFSYSSLGQSQVVIPTIEDNFDDANTSSWQVQNNMGASGSFSIEENFGTVKLKASGGVGSSEVAYIYRDVPIASDFSLTATISANFSGSTGNKRGGISVLDDQGKYTTFLIGKDMQNEWTTSICDSNGCTTPATYASNINEKPAIVSIIKLGNSMKIFRNGLLIHSVQTDLSNIKTAALTLATGTGADEFVVEFDDFHLIMGE